jgi:outer membrane protein
MTHPFAAPGLRAASSLLLLLLAAPVLAQTPAAADLPLWEIGAVGFGVSQQAYPGASEQVRRAGICRGR